MLKCFAPSNDPMADALNFVKAADNFAIDQRSHQFFDRLFSVLDVAHFFGFFAIEFYCKNRVAQTHPVQHTFRNHMLCGHIIQLPL